MDTLLARVARDSNDAPAHYEAALGLWLAKKYDAAERHLREAIVIDPKIAPAYLALSYLPYARRNHLWDEIEDDKVPAEWIPAVNEAFRLRRQAFLIDPLVDLKPLALLIPPTGAFNLSKRQAAVYTYLMNGFGAFWDGQYSKAYGFLQEIAEGTTEADRKNFPDWFLWYEGLAAAHTYQYDRSITDFRQLLTRAEARESPDSGAFVPFVATNDFRYSLATVLDQAGRTQEAIKLLQEAVSSDLGLYMAHVRLATIYEGQHRTNGALEERRRALAANPEDPSLLYDLGEALVRAGEMSEAYGVLEKAVAANPRNARALYVFARTASILEQPKEARMAYARFIEIAPSRFADQIAEARLAVDSLR